MKRVQFLITGLSLVIITASCDNAGPNKASESSANEEQKEVSSEVPVTQLSKTEATALINFYLKIKDALVASDPHTVQDLAASAKANLEGTEDELGQGIKGELEEMIATDNLEVQRTSLEDLTDKIYQLSLAVDVEQELYLQYCPMAFEGKGANWISNSDKIRNPYFGDRMLKCGRVEEKI